MGVVGLCALFGVAVAVGTRRSRLYLPKARRSGVTLLPWNLLTAVAIVRMSVRMHVCMYVCMYVHHVSLLLLSRNSERDLVLVLLLCYFFWPCQGGNC
jgi:hypothetical protein